MEMKNNLNFGYTGMIYMGSNLQPIRAIFDTGSANSWILSKNAVQANSKKFHTFDPDTSTTFTLPEHNKTVKITFGSGSL